MLKKIVSITLSVALLAGALPANAQPKPKKMNDDGTFYNPFGSYTVPSFGNYGTDPFANQLAWPRTKEEKAAYEKKAQEARQEHFKKLDQRVALSAITSANPYEGLSLLDAYYVWQKLPEYKKTKNFIYDYRIAPQWQAYKNAIKDYTTSPYKNYRPYQMMKAIDKETKEIAEALKKNPRYIKEVNRAKTREYGNAVLTGIIAGLTLVAAVYTCGLAGCGAAATWFGGTAATTTLMTTVSTASLAKAGVAIVLLEVASYLGMEITDRLYQDLTDRLVAYNYIDNGSHAQQLIDVATVGCVANSDMVECNNPLAAALEDAQSSTPVEVNPGTRWVDNLAREEAVIRLHALKVINAELNHSTESYKYDLALLDIINLLSFRQEVVFDENVFTRTTISGGEKHTQKNTNIVDVGTGRLIERKPELIKALKAIQKMEGASSKKPNRNIISHPRADANGMIWPSK